SAAVYHDRVHAHPVPRRRRAREVARANRGGRGICTGRTAGRPGMAAVEGAGLMGMTYSDYLHPDELLSLQRPRSEPEEHDELLFIITHQAYELWFKLLLHELDHAKKELNDGDLYRAIATFKRCRTVMKVLVEQVDIVETLTPMSFNSFRDRLDT